ncbi:YtxH domain-containing protein [Streptomyces boncukensis]|uniref:YtxH domain-containing protein n=1 Tax=Streptomyces boncukensis TaxID=2711219 RepID=A0A6G4X837_9ACTN|nr:YtxH domain-containing protein [Streptomyces boncukensis]NGO73548.1 YtxH domain-containing protein [Streptomyces boncukensis]
MRYRLTFVTGVAVGYVLGTRAGRERYEQLVKAARRVCENPAVRNLGEAASVTCRSAAGKAAGAFGNRCGRGAGAAERGVGTGDEEWGVTHT